MVLQFLRLLVRHLVSSSLNKREPLLSPIFYQLLDNLAGGQGRKKLGYLDFPEDIHKQVAGVIEKGLFKIALAVRIAPKVGTRVIRKAVKTFRKFELTEMLMYLLT